jgi:phospholipid N-methyltransferase
LAELVTDTAAVARVDSIVEFGPGTGVFTEVIARKLKPGAKFFAIEISEEFVKACAKRCPGVKVFHDSAGNVRKYMDQVGVQQLDCILSGLPFALFEDALQDDLLNAAYNALKPGGVFVTFTYVQSPLLPRGRRFRRKLQGRFRTLEKTSVVWKNFLPAFAYKAVK